MSRVAANIIAIAAVVYLLRAAQSLVIPIAIGVLLSYALEPVVGWLVRRGVPRIAAATLVVPLTFGGAAWGLYALADQIVAATDALPQAARTFRDTITAPGAGPAANLRKALQQINTPAGASRASDGNGTRDLVGSSAVAGVLQRAASSTLTVAGDIMVIVFLVFFLLLTAPRLRARAIEVAGPDPGRLRDIVDDVNAQIQRFLLVRLATAVLVGVATWAVLSWMHVQQAAFWGFASGAVNSIPYFGPVLVSGGLILVGLVQDGDLTRGLTMGGAALVITSIEGWLITPPLLGKAERMNVITVFVGILVWTWIWGPWGTVLAVPMLVMVKAAGDRVPSLQPLARLMGPL